MPDKKESRSELLAYNILVFGMAMIISKLITFILTPIYTRYFTPAEFGVFDLSITAISVIAPLGMLGTSDALFRFYFEEKDLSFRKQLISNGLRFVSYFSLLFSIFILFFNDEIAKFYLGSSDYVIYINLVALIVFLTNIANITQAIIRMENNRKIITKVTVIQAVSTFIFSVLFVVVLELNMEYILVTQAITLTIVIYITGKYGWKYINLKELKLDRDLMKQILEYGLPLTPVFLGYWILKTSDRLIISYYHGVSMVGIYAVGAKLSAIANLFQSIFGKGWQYFSFSTMEDVDAHIIYGKIFEVVFLFGILTINFLIFYSDLIFEVLFDDRYYNAWVVVPLLTVGPFVMILKWITGIGFQIKKKTYYSTVTIFIASIINVILNFLLIEKYNIMGAAVATVISYIILLFLTYWFGNKLFEIVINKRNVIFLFILSIVSYCLKYYIVLNNFYYSTILFFVFNIIYLSSNYKVTIYIIKKVIMIYKKWRS
ncbi:oligosaccharide flippase family protein [Halanaerobium congolense]|uniref:oligosaccharide flippase family protein n=1 Tax=Halanaerobium congolense TaxID=54121 RepID=UPI0010612FAD|nr:oligosaccharide flippase family protein [Halanaerobium congolense]TDP11589.1 O-antigen/teichoic acid export membrane protein [Halanaerobium congolense]